MQATHRVLAGIVLCALPAPLAAQSASYTLPGSLALPRIPVEERVRLGSEEARWDLGPVRVDPRLWVRDLGYIDNVFAEPDGADQDADATGTLGAGLAAYLNLGPKMVASAYLLPEYVWWQDLQQLRQENLNFGVGLFGFFNRLTTQLEGRRDESQRLLSSELLVPFDVREDWGALSFETDLRGPFHLFASLARQRLRYSGEAARDIPTVRLDTLDRDRSSASAGLAYTLGSGLRIGLGGEYTETNFLEDPSGRSNTTLGPLLQLGLGGGRLDLDASFVYRQVEFEGARDSDRSELTGSGRLGWQPRDRLRLDLYGGRNLGYSALAIDTYFTNRRIGLSVGSPWGRRLRLRGYFEGGIDEYEPLNDRASRRRDDVRALGGDLVLELVPRLTLEIGAARTELDSNLPDLDRTVTVLRVGLRAGGDTRPW